MESAEDDRSAGAWEEDGEEAAGNFFVFHLKSLQRETHEWRQKDMAVRQGKRES